MKSNKYYKLSLLLPALTVLVFALILFINSNLISPPKYPVLAVRSDYAQSPPCISIQIKDSKIIANIDAKKENTIDVLFYFSAESGEIVNIPYLEQINLEDKTSRIQEINIAPFKIISENKISPDGFKYKTFEYSDSFGDTSLINTGDGGRDSINKFFYKKIVKGYPNKFLAWIEVKNHE